MYAAWKRAGGYVFHFSIVREDKDATNCGLDRERMSDNVAIDNNKNDGTRTADKDIIEAMQELQVVMEV